MPPVDPAQPDPRHQALHRLPQDVQDLLALRALQGETDIDPDEAQGLASVSQDVVDDAGYSDLDYAAAEAELAHFSDAPLHEMPQDLVARVMASVQTGQPVPVPVVAPDQLNDQAEERASDQTEDQAEDQVDPTIVFDRQPTSPINSAITWIGWALAACMTLVVILMAVNQNDVDPVNPPPPTAMQPSTAEMYASLQQSDTKVAAAFNPISEDFADFAQVAGDIVIDPATQQGVMHFTNLPVNDPSQMQYQLWIVDAARGTPFDETPVPPVDGGVFDVNEQGEVFVPVNAKLPVSQPAVFVITVEKPGGVVVSDPTRYRLIADAR